LRRNAGVVSRPRRQLPAIDFDDAGGDTLEECTVVRHEQQRAAILGQERFEPENRVEVEMIGRFVEQKHVGVGHERTREQDAAAPSARQRVDDGICRQIEARQHELDALFDSPAVALFEIVLKAAELVQQRRRAFVCELDRRSVITRDQVAQLAEAVGDHIEDRTSRGEWNVLFERRDAQTRRRPHQAGVRRLLTAHDPKQRGFPRAVASDDRNPFARLDLQGRLIEQRQVSEGERDTIERNQGHE
jgi:hypothetical protein